MKSLVAKTNCTLSENMPCATYIICMTFQIKSIEKMDVLRIQVRLRRAFSQLIGYHCLCREVEWRRQLLFEEGNAEHEALLLKVRRMTYPLRNTFKWTKITVCISVDNWHTVSKWFSVLEASQTGQWTDRTNHETVAGCGISRFERLGFFCFRHYEIIILL